MKDELKEDEPLCPLCLAKMVKGADQWYCTLRKIVVVDGKEKNYGCDGKRPLGQVYKQL